MAKSKSIYMCQHCGAQAPKWEGKCRECGRWNTLVEELQVDTKAPSGWSVGQDKSSTGTLKSYALNSEFSAENRHRQQTGLLELDRVLGGGLVPGSYVLLGGDPGIGKSTLLLQMAGGLSQHGSVLYVSGEESVSQTALRAQRLGVKSEQVQVASESRLESILQLVEKVKPKTLVVDSVQTIYLSEIASAPGSVSQVRECAARLMGLAKGQNISVFLIGHVTKDGSLAGPKTLEHMVDTVLSFEGDSSHQFRLLRALKNRFGATNELGVFQMDSGGLTEVSNPSELFLEERGPELIGSAVFPAMEGSRPLLCEVQGLTVSSPMAMPRRTAIGFDVNRVHLLTAVLDKHLDLEFHRSDIFVNVVGGLKLKEPAADLAVAASLISAANFQEIAAKTCFFGEIGLTGEIRGVNFAEERVREAAKLGFNFFVLPASNKKHIEKSFKNKKVDLNFIRHVNELQQSIKHQSPTTEKPCPHLIL